MILLPNALRDYQNLLSFFPKEIQRKFQEDREKFENTLKTVPLWYRI